MPKTRKVKTVVMNELPGYLYTAEQTRALDAVAIEQRGIPGIVLMKRAARAVFEIISGRSRKQSIEVFCGAGNNAGDGYLVAALAKDAGWPVTVYAVSDPSRLKGDAREAFEFARDRGVGIQPFKETTTVSSAVVVDALLGTGLTREVAGDYATAIELINRSAAKVIAVDLPSGLSADTGMPLGSAVVADVTVTFIAVKQGLLTGKAPDFCGELVFNNLRVPQDIYDAVKSSASLLTLDDFKHFFAARKRCAHKGDFGRVLIVGGDSGYGGAAAMAAEAALRCGAGLVSVATRSQHIAPILARTPEAMAKAVENPQQLEPLLENVDVLVVGPGLGKSSWSEQMLQRTLSTKKPTVLDADALNLLVASGSDLPTQGQWIMTPHPGEAARLLGVTTTEIQADRYKAVRELQHKFQATVLLKGAGSLVCGKDQSVSVSTYGNPGMATGGMGDVLSGIIGALVAQGLGMQDALSLAVCLHGQAADSDAALKGERGMLPTDLFPHLRNLLNGSL